MKARRADHSHIKAIHAAAADLNGQARGKRLPAHAARKVMIEGIRFPFSAMNLDIWGEDIADSPLVFASGDQDGLLLPTGRECMPMPWLPSPSALVPIWMFHEDGRPFQGDPRHALAHVLNRYAARNWRPVVATELEFYLIDDGTYPPQPPRSPVSGKRPPGAEILSMRQIDAFDAFFTELYEACHAMDIPADAAISEGGPGQFEINMTHQDDALKTADDAWLFKMLTRGIARRHGFAASFMAKPYGNFSGNGMHTHFSVLDREGRNIFDNGREDGSAILRHAIAGALRALPCSTLIFAPHANSYDRLVRESHAPTGIAWAYENRTAAIRVPSGKPAARRIEHRVAGGDANPYLMLAAVLGAALTGIEDELEAPKPVTGNAYDQELEQLPACWTTAIDRFERDPITRRLFPDPLIFNLTMTKRQEVRRIVTLNDRETIELYLDTV
ncbi:MAG: glutamine synthetase family protein [Pseudomonadota bacterium]